MRHLTFRILWTAALLVFAFATLVPDAPAAESDTQDIADDTCIVELTLRNDAKVTIYRKGYVTRLLDEQATRSAIVNSRRRSRRYATVS